jgi:hypothetical protein
VLSSTIDAAATALRMVLDMVGSSALAPTDPRAPVIGGGAKDSEAALALDTRVNDRGARSRTGAVVDP